MTFDVCILVSYVMLLLYYNNEMVICTFKDTVQVAVSVLEWTFKFIKLVKWLSFRTTNGHI